MRNTREHNQEQKDDLTKIGAGLIGEVRTVVWMGKADR